MSDKIQRLAVECLQVQDACNLLGLSKRFAAVLLELRDGLMEAGEPFDSQSICGHPVTCWWIDKLRSLSGEADAKSYVQLCELAEQKLSEVSSD